MNTHYGNHSVAHGLLPGEFHNIDSDTTAKLMRLMARISEASYRRGFQHGKVLQETVRPEHLRFNVNLDHSPFTDAFYADGSWAAASGVEAIERLLMEYRVLAEVFQTCQPERSK